MSSTPETKKKKKTQGKKKDEMSIQRKRVAMEIVQTEQTYCKALHSIVAEYLLPLRQEGSMSKKNLNIVFSNIESICSFHQEQLANFEKDQRHMGPTFQKLIPFLELYREYCSNYAAAMEKVKEKMETSTKFANFVEKTRIEKQTLDLPSLLIQPIQRIPRYRLLLTELIKYTKPTSSDYEALNEALSRVEDAASFVNESIRERERVEELTKIQESLVGKGLPDLITPNRALWREGVLVKMCRREPKRRYFFLFNDSLIYTSIAESTINDAPQYSFHRMINLEKCAVQAMEDTDVMQNAFQVLSNEKSFTVFAETPELRNAWIQDIQDAIRQTQVERFAQSGASPTEVAPVWVPDKMQKSCTYCDSKFTTINRRHHCRRCGALVCGACSGNSHHLENLGKSARVCDVCYETLTGTVPSAKKMNRRQSSAVSKDLERMQNENNASKASLAKRATVLFGKGSAKSVVGIGPSRRPSSANVNMSTSETEIDCSTEGESDIQSSEVTDVTQDTLSGGLSDGAADGDEKKDRKKRKKKDGKRRKKRKKKANDGIKPLEQWSAEELETWLQTHDNGKFKRFADTFAGLSGADISILTEAQITAHVPGLFGNVLYNLFQLHKEETIARSQELESDGEDDEDLEPPAHDPPPPPTEEDQESEGDEATPPSHTTATPKPLPTPPSDPAATSPRTTTKPLPTPPPTSAASPPKAAVALQVADAPLPKPLSTAPRKESMSKFPTRPPPKVEVNE